MEHLWLNRWGIYVFNGLGIYDLMGGTVMTRWVTGIKMLVF